MRFSRKFQQAQKGFQSLSPRWGFYDVRIYTQGRGSTRTLHGTRGDPPNISPNCQHINTQFVAKMLKQNSDHLFSVCKFSSNLHLSLKVNFPQMFTLDVEQGLLKRRADLKGTDMKDGYSTISTTAPLSDMFGYMSELR